MYVLDKSEMGFRIWAEMDKRKINRAELSRMSCVSETAIAKTLKGKSQSTDTIAALCAALNLSADYVIFGRR